MTWHKPGDRVFVHGEGMGTVVQAGLPGTMSVRVRFDEAGKSGSYRARDCQLVLGVGCERCGFECKTKDCLARHSVQKCGEHACVVFSREKGVHRVEV